MPTDVIMPQMGESIFEGTITRWLKKAGDAVEKDEPLFEISTDKVDAEIPSPVAGVLSEIKVPEGTTVQVNTVVAVVAEGGAAASNGASRTPTVIEPVKRAPTIADPAIAHGTDVVMPQMGESIFEGTITRWLKKVGDGVAKDEPLFEISTDKVDAEIPSPVAGVLTEIKAPEGVTIQVNTVVAVIGGAGAAAGAMAPMTAATTFRRAATVAEAPPAEVNLQAPGGGRLRSSPLVRRMAKENNLDLRRITGSGSEGRITKEDVLRHLSRRRAENAASAAPQVPPSASDVTLAERVVPLSKMRAIIAQRMVESVQISPHVHTVYKVDMTRIVRLREREKQAFEQRHGIKLTFMPFVAAAVVEALRKYPIVNASMENGSIHYHRKINLGIAVALEWGLIVPVVKQAESRDFAGLARAIAGLAERARTKKLMPDEVMGSTFTLTNSGVFGDEFSTPIINQPDSAILAISGLKKEAVVLTDQEGNDTIAIRQMQHFCLGFDHRTIDGADACRFMLELKRMLETWDKAVG